MILHVISDLHIDHWNSTDSFLEDLDIFRSKWVEPDALVVAGDTCELSGRGVLAAHQFFGELCSRYSQVIVTTGNHEAWGSSIEAVAEEVDSWDYPNLHQLVPGRPYTLNGQRFLGGTGWYPDNGAPALQEHFSDYRAVKNFKREVYLHHGDFRAMLVAHMGPTDVVVSHHTPSPRCTPAKFRTSLYNDFFVMDGIEELVKAQQPKLWISGHTHTPYDIRLGNTRLYANPFGYPHEKENAHFWERVAITL